MKIALILGSLLTFGSLHAQEKALPDSFYIHIKFPPRTVVKKAQLNGSEDDRSIEIIKSTDKNKTFRGVVRSYGLFDLMVDYYDSSKKKMLATSVPLFIVPGHTEIEFEERSPMTRINGVSAAPRFEYALLIQDDEVYIEQEQQLGNQLEEQVKAGNKEEIAQTRKEIKKIEKERLEKLYAAYVHRNPRSPVSLYAMTLYAMINDINPLEVEALLNSMPSSQQQTSRMLQIRKRIEQNKTTMVGAMAPEFSQADTSGNQLTLKTLQGNYVLLDFWASWCHPCRDQNPSLVKLYDKFKSRGFTILSVSLDSKMESWKEAIRHDKLAWHNVSDLKFWNNEVARLFAITSVPQNFLLDAKGKIVARNLAEEELENMLDEVYKNNTVN